MWYLLKSEVNVDFVLPGQICTDINECETGAARNCVPNSICINTRVSITGKPHVDLSSPGSGASVSCGNPAAEEGYSKGLPELMLVNSLLLFLAGILQVRGL